MPWWPLPLSLTPRIVWHALPLMSPLPPHVLCNRQVRPPHRRSGLHRSRRPKSRRPSHAQQRQPKTVSPPSPVSLPSPSPLLTWPSYGPHFTHSSCLLMPSVCVDALAVAMEEDLCFLRGLVPWVPEEVVAFVYTHHCNGHRVCSKHTKQKHRERADIQNKGTQSKEAIIGLEKGGR